MQRFQFIEYIVNSRSILQNDGRLLSTFELAMGKPMYIGILGSLIDPFEFLQRNSRIEELGRLWISYFVRQLPRSTNTAKTEVRMDDWVMIPKLMSDRAKWPVGQIIEINQGSDDICRSVNDKITYTDVD